MAQLDISIVYNQFFVAIVSLYFFTHFISLILLKFWYISNCSDIVSSYNLESILYDNFYIKSILSL